jgi:thymidine kinase
MFSGKTTELLRRVNRCLPHRVLGFKHAIDNRYRTDAIVTHSGQAMAGVSVANAEEIVGRIHDDVELVAVDEGHFFGEALVGVCRALLARGVSVTITSLDRDSWGKPFGAITAMNSFADEAIVMHAVCERCGASADRTQRLTPIIDGNMVVGPESYAPRCQSCWTPPPEPPS